MSPDNQTQTRPKYRIAVDLPEAERELLQQLCDQDFRDPAQEFRYLIDIEARRRGLKRDAGMLIAEAQ